MSGQPYKYATDIDNFRADYMKSLGLRANLDDMNLQANKNYKDTGALPPQSTMKDTRTTPEILADVGKLKLSLINELKAVASTQMAQLVVQRVEQSPLNADGSFLIWFSQNVPELVLNLKRKYKFGIAGNDNDAEQMFLFLQSIYARSKDLSQSVKSAFDRPSTDLYGSINAQDLSALGKVYDEIQFRLISKLVNVGEQGGPEIRKLLTDIRMQFDALIRIMSTKNYEDVKEIFLRSSSGHQALMQQNINLLGYSDFINFVEKLPSPSILRTLLDQLQKSERNQTPDLSIQILQNLSSVLPLVQKSAEISQLIDNIIDTDGATSIVSPLLSNNPSLKSQTPQAKLRPIRTNEDDDVLMYGVGLKRRGRPKGSGLVKPISERIDHTKGIKQGHTHVPFGKYILNKNKLDSDLVYFKHMKGYGVKGFPMAKVSKNLGSVLRTIIGGGVPKFEELQGLSNEEKEYLHKVANKAGIMDKLSIPSPSKDKLEQDIHQFEVMKGEILSGNDSPELIKKFKLILLRLSKNGNIPKREATELMEDLIQLGF